MYDTSAITLEAESEVTTQGCTLKVKVSDSEMVWKLVQSLFVGISMDTVRVTSYSPIQLRSILSSTKRLLSTKFTVIKSDDVGKDGTLERAPVYAY